MTVYAGWIEDAATSWLSGKTIKALLVDSTYVPDPTETTMTAATAAEVSGTAYSAGGITVTSLVSFTADSAGVHMELSAFADFGPIVVADVSGIVFYVSGGKPIVVDMFGSIAPDGSANFTYGQGASGALLIQVAP